MKVLLDSVILIDHMNGVRQASHYLLTVDAAVSVVTRAEVLAGRAGSDALTLLDLYPTLEIDRQTSDMAGGLRRTHKWRLPDAFQAAIAQIHGLKLATRNTRDFPPKTHSFVIVPYTL